MPKEPALDGEWTERKENEINECRIRYKERGRAGKVVENGKGKIEESQMGLEYRGGGLWEVAVARRSLQEQPCTCQRGDYSLSFSFLFFSFLPFLRRMNYQSR